MASQTGDTSGGFTLPAGETYNFFDPTFTTLPLSTAAPAFLKSQRFKLWFLGFMGLLVLADFMPAVAAGIAAVLFFEAVFAAVGHTIGSL